MAWSRLAGCTLLLAAACQSAPQAPPAVLTLVPAALRTTGEATAVDEQTLCLHPGASALTSLYVHQPSVTMTVAARNRDGTGAPVLVVRVGAAKFAAQAVTAPEAQGFTFRERVQGGEQPLQLSVQDGAAGEVCIEQIAITQP